MVGVCPPGAAARCRFDQSASGALGAQDCHPAITLAAFDQGQVRKKITGDGAGTVLNWNQVAMPKFPPPPPRHAQYRSECDDGLAVSALPSAVMMFSEASLSQVSP